MRIILALVLILPLGGCLTTQEQMAEAKARNDALDDKTCQSYGAKPGTDIYIQCRMQRQQTRDVGDNAIAAAAASSPVIVNNVSATPPSAPTFQPIYNPGPRCTSRGC